MPNKPRGKKGPRYQTLDTAVAIPAIFTRASAAAAAAAAVNNAADTVNLTATINMEQDMKKSGTETEWEKFSEKIIQQMNNRFDKLDVDIKTVQRSQAELSASLTGLQDQVNNHDERIDKLEAAVTMLGQENATLRAKLDGLEGNSRRNNIKILGIPEGEENNNPTEFVQNLIPKLLGESSFENAVIIDRAHRSPRPRPPEGGKPRAIFARVHFFKEKELILRLRRSKDLLYKGNKVMIFPDYTADVLRQRREFNPVMAKLRDLKVEFQLFFPAKLRITHQGKSGIFSKPGEAMAFINSALGNLC